MRISLGHRWTIKEEPNWERWFKKNEVIHPVISSWKELKEEEKTMLIDVKQFITSCIGECKVGLFGSRIKGYWREDSDYDICVTIPFVSEKDKNLIKQHKYKGKIDISFAHYRNETTDVNEIYIP